MIGRSRTVLVLLASFVMQFFIAILTYGAGFIHLSLLEVFKESDATTSIVGSLFINLMSATGKHFTISFASLNLKYMCAIIFIYPWNKAKPKQCMHRHRFHNYNCCALHIHCTSYKFISAVIGWKDEKMFSNKPFDITTYKREKPTWIAS